MGHPALLSVGVMVFVAVLSVFSLVYRSWADHREARRRHRVHRLGLGADTPVPTLGGPPLPQPWRWLQAQLDAAADSRTPRALVVHTLLWALGGGLLTVWLLPGPEKLVGLLCAAVPLLHLRSRARGRAQQMTLQLPDALDRIGRTLRAGHAFSDSLRIAARELPSPIGDEFARVSETHRLGMDMRECLEELSNRHPKDFDVRLFVGAVLLNRETGGNLAEILDHLADTVRERLLFQQKLASLTAETKMSAVILGILPFFLGSVLLLLRPAYLLPLVSTDIGRMMLVGALASLAAGAASMRWLARVEV